MQCVVIETQIKSTERAADCLPAGFVPERTRVYLLAPSAPNARVEDTVETHGATVQDETIRSPLHDN